jgi:pimeloyl-ACP methyl ester carboxylesterase
LFFVQGWPDDHTLWDECVAALRDRYRCVRVDLPNYQRAEYRRWGFSNDAIVEGIAACIRKVSPERPVTVVAHDWGAWWTYMLYIRHRDLVSRIVALDVAPHLWPTPREAAIIVLYQGWLITAFVVGGRVGNWMTRTLARLVEAPRQGQVVRSAVNYPYMYTWLDFLSLRLFRGRRCWPEVPLLYAYGEAKPLRFHSETWLAYVRSRPKSAVLAMERAGHWVTKDPQFASLLRDWLEATAEVRELQQVAQQR